MTAAPPTSTLPGFYQGEIASASAEGARASVALTVYVGHGETGTVTFVVTDSAGLLPGAEVTLISPTTALSFQGLTGAEGSLAFGGIPQGGYNYQATAPGHTTTWGQFVLSGEPQQIAVALADDYVNFEWEVRETEIDDVYDVFLTITYRLGDSPILVPCGPWHEFSLPGGGGGHGGALNLTNPTAFTLRDVNATAAGLAGISMTLANDGHIGAVAGGTEVLLNYTATGSVGGDHQAGGIQVTGVYTGSDGLEHSYTSAVHLLVNPTAPLTCTCELGPGYYRSTCQRPGVPGDPGAGPPAPPYYGGWDPIVVGPYTRARVRLSQTATLSRQAFFADLNLATRGDWLSGIQVTLTVVDAAGLDAGDRFSIDDSQAQWRPEMGPHDLQFLHWVLVPRACAGGTEASGQEYRISAQVAFTVTDEDLHLEFSTERSPITVRPEPRVFLYYYLPQEIEQDVPFRVQIVAQNWGYGPARDVRMGAPTVQALDGGGLLDLEVVGSDLELGDVGPFQEAMGYVDLRPTGSGYVESVVAGLTHRDFQGLRLDPLVLRQQTYLVYCDHVELAAEASLPDPGPECAPAQPPPAPQAVRVQAEAQEIVAFPGETVVHTFRVYNLDPAEPLDVALQATSARGWLTQVTPMMTLPPGGIVPVVVGLDVPAGAGHGDQDQVTLVATSQLDPRVRADDSALTLVSPIKILRIDVLPGTQLLLNADGWYEPNPLTYRVFLDSRMEGWIQNLTLQIKGSGRLQAFPVDYPSGSETGRAWVCGANDCSEFIPAWPVSVGQNVIDWQVWVQPTNPAATLSGRIGITWDGDPDHYIEGWSPNVAVPATTIHPVLIVPGLLGTFPPSESGGLVFVYSPLISYLEDLGYKEGESLFTFPYDWRQHVNWPAFELLFKIDSIQELSKPAYVSSSRVDIVAHSMGGLVARAYLECDVRDDVGKLITLATPHRGAPYAYPVWEGGELSWWLAKLMICGHLDCTPREVFDYVRDQIPSLQDLLPTADVTGTESYLVDAAGNAYPFGRPENLLLDDLNDDGPVYHVGYLISTPGLSISAFYGLGYYTSVAFGVDEPGPLPMWEHGRRVGGRDVVGAGDGTVPEYSAQISKIHGLEGLASQERTFETGEDRVSHDYIPTGVAVVRWVARVLTGVDNPPAPHW